MSIHADLGLRTFVVLLRGVMPTGKNKVSMAPLRAALSNAGLGNVRTYIQSGNVIATSALDRFGVEKLVRNVIRTELGAELAVIARTASEFQDILSRNPFAGADTARLYFSLLCSPPAANRAAAFTATDWSPDEVRIVGDVVYTLYATRHSDSRFSNNYFERKLDVAATTRNFNTMSKLVEVSTA